MKILSVISERQLFLANLIVNIVFHYLMSILAVIPEEPQYKYTCLGKEEINFYFSFRKIPLVFHLILYHYKQTLHLDYVPGIEISGCPEARDMLFFEWTCRISENFNGKGPDFNEISVWVYLCFAAVLYTAMYNLNFRVLNTFNSWFRYILLLSPVKQPFHYKYCLYMSV